MNNKTNNKLSKFLSLLLRHSPKTIGITLDENGWTDVIDLIDKMNKNGEKINMEILKEIVNTDNKSRYTFDENYTKIRATQGHSVKVELGYIPQKPPIILYHGTGKKYIESIFKDGIKKQSRNHVHLSGDKETALKVGQRHGTPIILEILSEEMYNNNHQFFLSENGVWLTDYIPVEYIKK
jgi:RNA:NAD 2''-phosphotransferase